MNKGTNSPFKRILVVRLGSMGDIIHTLPAVGALRTVFPEVQIGWVVEERWAELLCADFGRRTSSTPCSPDRPLVNRIHLARTHAWRTSPFAAATWSDVLAARRELRSMDYDLALDFQGTCKSAVTAFASGAPLRIGFGTPRERAAGVFYTRQVDRSGVHIIEQNFRLLAGLISSEGNAHPDDGLVRTPPAPKLPLSSGQELWADEELTRQGLRPHGFVIINPGAGWAAKCWSAENYAAVVQGLGECGIKTLINYGPGEEEVARVVASSSRGASLAKQYALGELIALTRRARLFVGGDTGPMHLAAALGVPVVAIFGPTDPARNGPYATESIVLRSPNSVTDHSRRADPDGAMLAISATEVLSAARRLLERTSTQTTGKAPIN